MPPGSNRTPLEQLAAADSKKYRKMPMCISFGYVGTGFHGLQSQPAQPELPTVAKTLRQV